jgi:hypothetical protein
MVREIIYKKYWLTANPSATFHGRDIMAPVGAHLCASRKPGEIYKKIGPIRSNPVRLNIPEPIKDPRGVTGKILYFDHFGNAITNITQSDLARRKRNPWKVKAFVNFGPFNNLTLGVLPEILLMIFFSAKISGVIRLPFSNFFSRVLRFRARKGRGRRAMPCPLNFGIFLITSRSCGLIFRPALAFCPFIPLPE